MYNIIYQFYSLLIYFILLFVSFKVIDIF